MSTPVLVVDRVQVNGPLLPALGTAAVPAHLAARWQLASEHQVRTLYLARSGDEVVGAAFAVHRPLTSYEKLAGLWAAGGDADTVAALLAAVQQDAAEVAVLKIDLDPRSVQPVQVLAELAARAGFVEQPAPVAGAAPPIAPEEVPPGLVRWAGAAPSRAVPYYRQSTDFTCGPVSVGMTLAGTGDDRWIGRAPELAMWREATTQYGCDPFGLAVASVARGSRPEIHLTHDDPILLENASSEWERDLRRFLQTTLREQAVAADLTIRRGDLPLSVVLDHVRAGGVAVLLIDEYPMHAEHCPHWVVVHGVLNGPDGTEVAVVNDPWTDDDLGETWLDAVDLPIPVTELDKLAQWGDPSYRAALLYPGDAS